MYDKSVRSFDGASVNLFAWQDHPDGRDSAESQFHLGYLEVYVFGDGTHPLIKQDQWRIFYLWPRFEPEWCTVEIDQGGVVLIEEQCSLFEIHIGTAKLNPRPEAKTFPVLTIEFELPSGDLIRKHVLLESNGKSAEVPDETIH